MSNSFMESSSLLFTSESVTEGHPDKMCDLISDAILDDALRQDPMSRVAIECGAKNGGVMVFGEMTTKGYVDVPAITRSTIKNIGYIFNKKPPKTSSSLKNPLILLTWLL